MSCPQCGHFCMQNICATTVGEPGILFWCKHCGTVVLRASSPDEDVTYTPDLSRNPDPVPPTTDYGSTVNCGINPDGSATITIDGIERGRYDSAHELALTLGCAMVKLDSLKQTNKEPVTQKKRIEVQEERGEMVAEWSPLQPGCPIVGRGKTILEAVGSLVVYDEMVDLLMNRLNMPNARFSARDRDPPRHNG